MILAVAEELVHRKGLEIAFDNLPENSLLDLLGFVYKKCDSPEHQKAVFFLFDCLMNRLNKISPSGKNDKVDGMLKDIKDKLAVDIQTSSQMNELEGLLEMISIMG